MADHTVAQVGAGSKALLMGKPAASRRTSPATSGARAGSTADSSPFDRPDRLMTDGFFRKS
jgi:hypothetical protein